MRWDRAASGLSAGSGGEPEASSEPEPGRDPPTLILVSNTSIGCKKDQNPHCPGPRRRASAAEGVMGVLRSQPHHPEQRIRRAHRPDWAEAALAWACWS